MRPKEQKPFPPRGKSRSTHAWGNQWERNVYLGLNEYVRSLDSGYVHHMIQPVNRCIVREPQIIDILADNIEGYFFGIECKSAGKPESYAAMWFPHNREQYWKEQDFLARAGRCGIIAFLLPAEEEGVFGSYLIPWHAYPSLCHRKLTAAVLDREAAQGSICKIPTSDGTVKIEQGVLAKLAWMERTGEYT
ncbi:MAG: hypothetical protein MJ014_00045 [Methanocorpusculum sp.]|nr:hypothetical protein [Methanocorpusculum sp.]